MGSARNAGARPMTMPPQKDVSVLNKIKSFFNPKRKDKKTEIKNDKPTEAPAENKREERNVADEIVKNFGEKLRLEIKNPNTDKTFESKRNNAVDNILDSFQTLKISALKEQDEDAAFTKKFIEEDRRSERIDSQSSEDSGFADVKEEDDVIETVKSVSNKGEKRLQKIVSARKPIRAKLNDSSTTARPYPVQDDLNCRQISQINKNTLTGGQVLVNANLPQDNFAEVDIALKKCEQLSRNAQQEQSAVHWQDVMDIIHKDNPGQNGTTKHQEVPLQTDVMYNCLLSPPSEDLLSDFVSIQQDSFGQIHIEPHNMVQPNPIEQFDERTQLPNYEECVEISKMLELDDGITSMTTEEELHKSFIFPTPPRSENVPSPRSESQTSFYRPHSDYTLSPERSSPINSDYEKFQEIFPFEEFPYVEKTPTPVNTMTMKQFKDLQKEISYKFSKKECCQANRKCCKEILEGHMQKLKKEDRRNLCFNIAKLDLKTAYGVLHQIILSFCRGTEQEDLQLALFGLLCERVLVQSPSLFVGDFGLNLLKSAVLRCPQKDFLTRYLVHCIRTAMKVEPALVANKEFVFDELDALGDNLLIACVRQGDRCALVLGEIFRKEADQIPLFKIHHTNGDGYTALHVACNQHSTAESKLHIIHVLLEHGGADIWKGDVKGGDTAIHLAVNSANCDLNLVLMIFKQVHRKEWKKLAHCHNMSSVTPLEYARSATKSTTRQNYPPEVLDFLKRCR